MSSQLLRSSSGDLTLEGKKFTNREDIKPWLSNYLQHNKGINVVIQRSDSNKIIFKCSNKDISGHKGKPHRNDRKIDKCPFKIRANFSIRNGHWNLVVVNDKHNHTLFRANEDVENILNREELSASDESGDQAYSANKFTFDGLTNLRPSESVNSSFQSLTLPERPLKRKSSASDTNKQLKVPRTPDAGNYSLKVLNTLRKDVTSLVNRAIVENKSFDYNEKYALIRSFTKHFIADCHRSLAQHNQTTLDTSWLIHTNDSTSHPNGSANSNLIPLSPLLNDSDNELKESTGEDQNVNSIDSLNNIPSSFSSVLSPGGLVPSQVSQIQNQAQQLPSFNSIQNQLPISPSSGNVSSMMGNSSSVLMPPLSNNSNTLNPSSLLKSSNNSKGNFSANSSSSVTNLNDFKIGGLITSNGNNLSGVAPQSGNGLSNVGPWYSVNGVSAPSPPGVAITTNVNPSHRKNQHQPNLTSQNHASNPSLHATFKDSNPFGTNANLQSHITNSFMFGATSQATTQGLQNVTSLNDAGW